MRDLCTYKSVVIRLFVHMRHAFVFSNKINICKTYLIFIGTFSILCKVLFSGKSKASNANTAINIIKKTSRFDHIKCIIHFPLKYFFFN